MTNIFEIIEHGQTMYLVTGDDISHALVTWLSFRRKDGGIEDIFNIEVTMIPLEEMETMELEHDGKSMTLAEIVNEMDESEVIAVADMEIVEYTPETDNSVS